MAARTKSKVTPKYKTEVSGEELSGLRGGSPKARRCHVVVQRGRHRCVERTDERSPRRPASLLRSDHRDRVDLARRVTPPAPPDRGLPGVADPYAESEPGDA